MSGQLRIAKLLFGLDPTNPNQIELGWNLLIHGSGRNTTQVPIEIDGGQAAVSIPAGREGGKEGGGMRELLLFDVKALVSL